MLKYAGFNYPKTTYQLPDPCNLKGLRKKRELRKVCGPYYTPEPYPLTGGEHPGGSFYLDSDFQPGRRTEYADKIIRLDHTGWYCDEDQDQTIRGIVICLPHERFLAGWSMGEGMASEYAGTIYDDEEEAAKQADRLAQIAAEAERDYRREQDEADEIERTNQGSDAEECAY